MGGDKIKVVQAKVVVGKGSGDFFKEVDFDFPMGKELFMIQKVHKWIDVYDVKVVGGNKVIFNAWIYKNVAYKTACHPCVDKDGIVTVSGDIVHITKRIPLAGCIDVETDCGFKFKKGDKAEGLEAEVLEAEVIGEVEDLLCPKELGKESHYPLLEEGKMGGKGKMPCEYSAKCDEDPVVVYKRLHEKMCIRIKVKVVKMEHLSVKVADCGDN